MRNTFSIVLICCFYFSYSQTQEKVDDYFISSPRVDSVPYSFEYLLKEGLYLKLNNFKQNFPIEAEQIIIDYPKDRTDFWDQVMMKRSINYKNSSGRIQKINMNELWGYSINKKVYINTSVGFKKCIIVGSLCYLDKWQNSTNNVAVVNGKELVDLNAKSIAKIPEKIDVFDMETNSSEELDSGDLKLILAREPELLKEYSALSYKRRKQTVLLYLRKYNEKHPLYLPVK